MSAASVATVVKMFESLPDPEQELAAEHMREYIEELREEREWDAKIAASPDILASAVKRAKREIAAGLSEPMDFDRL